MEWHNVRSGVISVTLTARRSLPVFPNQLTSGSTGGMSRTSDIRQRTGHILENLKDYGSPIFNLTSTFANWDPNFVELLRVQSVGVQLFLRGTEMKHQVHVATESGIVSTEAVMQIKRLITDLARTVNALDAAKNRPRADADDLDTRRRNLMVTIASLEDRLDCIEKVRSHEYGAHANLAVPRAHVARIA